MFHLYSTFPPTNDIKFIDPVSIANQFNNYFVNAGIELSERFKVSSQ